MKLDHTKIKTISINLNNGSWNADTHNILLTRDENSAIGFTMQLIEITDEKMIHDLRMANDVLNKFRKLV
jgi:uncharacterized protein YihD (DUF1040 family)